jgi:hypothetical protein
MKTCPSDIPCLTGHIDPLLWTGEIVLGTRHLVNCKVSFTSIRLTLMKHPFFYAADAYSMANWACSRAQ